MPQNCSADVQAVIAHFDAVADDPDAFNALKAQFGMADIEHADDATGARACSPSYLIASHWIDEWGHSTTQPVGLAVALPGHRQRSPVLPVLRRS